MLTFILSASPAATSLTVWQRNPAVFLYVLITFFERLWTSPLSIMSSFKEMKFDMTEQRVWRTPGTQNTKCFLISFLILNIKKFQIFKGTVQSDLFQWYNECKWIVSILLQKVITETGLEMLLGGNISMLDAIAPCLYAFQLSSCSAQFPDSVFLSHT